MSEWEFVKPKKSKQTRKAHPATHRAQNGRVSQAKLDHAAYCQSSSSTDDMRDRDMADESTLSSLVLQVTTARQAIRHTSFYQACVAALAASLTAKSGGGGSGGVGARFSRAVLLGLGQFSQSRPGGAGDMPCILQLALVLELLAEPSLFLAEEEKEKDEQQQGQQQVQRQPRAFIYDPVMTGLDAALCSAVGLTVMADSHSHSSDNTTPAHLQPWCTATDTDSVSVSTAFHSNTLFYMPHCPYLLYNHVLWSHWAPHHLVRLVILGNSFDSYNMRHLGQRSTAAGAGIAAWDCVQALADILSEQSVWLSQRAQAQETSQPCLAYMEHAFNDMR